MKKTINYAVLLLFCFAIIACTEDEPLYEATEINITQIQSDPGFWWYNIEYSSYKLDAVTINKLQDTLKNIDISQLSFVVFTAPSCLCGSDYIKFPQLMKVFDSTGITANNYQIFVNKDESTNFLHPYSDIITVTSIPALYIIKNKSTVFAVIDKSTETSNKNVETTLLESICAIQQ